MSENNYDTFQRIKERAKTNGLKVTKLYDAHWGMGGVNVYVHPKEIDILKLSGDEDGERAKYRVAWFMELPTEKKDHILMWERGR